jgi:hypothetical protein
LTTEVIGGPMRGREYRPATGRGAVRDTA